MTPAACPDTPPLQRAFTTLVVTNADRLIHFGEEDLAIANLARACRPDDGLHRFLDHRVAEHKLDLDLGDQVDGVLAAAIELRWTLLAARAAHFEERHALDADLLECGFYGFQAGGLDDGFDFGHGVKRSRRTRSLLLRA